MAEKPVRRLGEERTVLLAFGAFLGVLIMSYIIHLLRMKGVIE